MSTDMIKIDVKIRHEGHENDWENMPVDYQVSFLDIGDLNEVLRSMVKSSESWSWQPKAAEVRWNYVGSFQGHYVTREKLFAETESDDQSKKEHKNE